MTCLDLPRNAMGMRLGVLDELGFVEHQQMKLLLQQDFLVAHEQRVSRENEIGIGDIGKMQRAGRTVQGQHLEARREAFRLAAPVGDKAGGHHDHAGQGGTSADLFKMQMRQCLDGLAQAHVVGQDAGEVVAAKELQPAQTSLLVLPQGGLEAFCGFDLFDAGEILEPMRELPYALTTKPAARQGFQFDQAARIEPPQTQAFAFTGKLQQRPQPDTHAPGRHREDVTLADGQGNPLVVVETPQVLQQLRTQGNQPRQRFDQADPLAIDDHAKIEIEPFAVVEKFIFQNFDEPVLGLQGLKGEIVIHFDGDAGLLQTGQAQFHEQQPARRVLQGGHQTIVRGIRPGSPGPWQALPVAFQALSVKQRPDGFLGGLVTQNGHEGGLPLGRFLAPRAQQ